MSEDEEIVLSFASKDWKPIPRVGRTIPFGYRPSEDDPDVLIPVKEELDYLEQAKVHLKQYSYRAVANWLSEKSGRYISHMGLKKRVEFERYKGTRVNGLRRLAKRAEAARAKAEAILQNRLGAYEGSSDPDS